MEDCPDSFLLGSRSGTTGITGITGTVVKLEAGVSSPPGLPGPGLPCLPGLSCLPGLGLSGPDLPGPEAHQASELHFLRSRVRDLEREKSNLTAENQRLKSLLVHEIPGLLSTMWQTLGRVDSQQSVSMATGGGYPAYLHQNLQPANQDAAFGSGFHARPIQEVLKEDPADSWEEEEAAGGGDPVLWSPEGEEEEAGGGDPVLWSPAGEEAPLCRQTDLEELRRSCSESQCTAGGPQGQVSQVEVYPGSGVLCDVRSWQAANQAQSPTAMARMLLLGVFDVSTLMASNLRGGRSRRPAFQQQRSALDPHKTSAIYNSILARFPLAKKGVIGSCINSKLSEMRFRSRRANQHLHFF